MNSEQKEQLRQDPDLKKYFPEGTSNEDITKVVMKILQERQEMKNKPKENQKTEEPKKTLQHKEPSKKKQEKKHTEKTCSFCHNKGHQRSKCPKKLYPGLDL